MKKELPADFRVIALAKEAEEIRQNGCPQYTYGKLVADTTLEERDAIEEKWRGYFAKRGNHERWKGYEQPLPKKSQRSKHK